ncbi:uncharacterized protein EV422DRAFT_324453 [Fimicolochytrium jonesii]|uniref:uncharacterized protein n=1 Tax=Fimicolochytrium jonesii TaxID=1396493 RepID=UPI0022FDC253|nr:uncharacterized protein EV422DRAFT_324453 [Fimicolochytrium jonesii]KAI8824536.1 hypothetical protein EV422DRAFT_324453 [Fimicolochytrium jonesii]
MAASRASSMESLGGSPAVTSRKASLHQQQSVSKPLQKAPFADNPTHGVVPLSATEIFLQRLNGWAQLVKRLITQFEAVIEHQKRMAESYSKLARDFQSPVRTRDGEAIFGPDETTQFLFQGLLSSHIQAAQENTEAAELLDQYLLPDLRSLLADLRKKGADTDREWTGLDKELQHDRETYVKLAAQLRIALARHGGEAYSGVEKESSAWRDPWTVNKSLKRHIALCLHKQDHYRATLLNQQKHFATFESSIVQTLQLTLSTFFDWQNKDLTSAQATFRKLKATLSTLDVAKDWQSFSQQHIDRILPPDAVSITEDMIAYEGQSHPLIHSTKEGMMYKKDSTMFRKAWKEVMVVVTTANYLHVIPSATPTPSANANSPLVSILTEEEEVAAQNKASEPELSLYLPDCVVGPLMMNEKEPEEFFIQEKAGGMFGGEKKHKFKGANMDQSATWWGYLSERVRMAKQITGSAQAQASPVTPVTPTSSNGALERIENAQRQQGGAAIDPLTGAPLATARVQQQRSANPDPLGATNRVATPQGAKPVRPTSGAPQGRPTAVATAGSRPRPAASTAAAENGSGPKPQRVADVPVKVVKRATPPSSPRGSPQPPRLVKPSPQTIQTQPADVRQPTFATFPAPPKPVAVESPTSPYIQPPPAPEEQQPQQEQYHHQVETDSEPDSDIEPARPSLTFTTTDPSLSLSAQMEAALNPSSTTTPNLADDELHSAHSQPHYDPWGSTAVATDLWGASAALKSEFASAKTPTGSGMEFEEDLGGSAWA